MRAKAKGKAKAKTTPKKKAPEEAVKSPTIKRTKLSRAQSSPLARISAPPTIPKIKRTSSISQEQPAATPPLSPENDSKEAMPNITTPLQPSQSLTST